MFLFFEHTSIKYLIIYSHVDFGRQWAKIEGGRRDITRELILEARCATKIWLCLFGHP
jgi:hypothetical protein